MSRPAPGRKLSQLARLEVSTLNSVKPRRAAALGAMGIESVLDLLTHYPRRFVDRSTATPIGELVPGEEAVIAGSIESLRTRRGRGRRAIVDAVIADRTGSIALTFFNQPWRARQLVTGEGYVVVGRPDTYRQKLQMANPVVDTTGTQTGRIVAIYPQSEKAGVSSPELSGYITEALDRAGAFADPLPDALRARLRLIDRTAAFRSIHLPETMEARYAARARLAFDELLRLQVSLVSRKRAAAAAARGIAHRVAPGTGPDLVGAFLSNLPFSLTAAQARVISEIATDLGAPEPMHRLLQGDVGSGKTVVALASLLYGVQGGHETALMVPTEVLAEQHYLAARALLGDLEVDDPRRLLGRRPVRIALLSARTTGRERDATLRGLSRGEVDIVVGTHALLTDDVEFSSLGVVVIDEQHRFGVDQRAALREKGTGGEAGGHDPDLLVMTATPIPRTAAMTVYGDLDYSVLDELPKGRAPIRTRWVETEADRDRMWTAVRSELRAGHQVYVVCPLVRRGEEPEGIDAADLAVAPSEETDEIDAPAISGKRTRASRAEPALGPGGAAGDGRLFDDAPGEEPHRAPAGAVETFEALRAGELAGARIGLLHGQMPGRDKEAVMAAFRAGELSVLVATTVIEVGVDVGPATVMVIEDADRFGIAQLHQLRGRVGRGRHASVCYLSTGAVSDEARARLEALVRSSDGFELAEIDLELRGEGTVLGARQKGRNDLKLASLRRDRDLVERARRVASSILDADPDLSDNPVLSDELGVFVGEEEQDYLFRS